jgi:hypothetical protein
MVVDERSRHQLYRRLEEVLGPDAATTLIEHLPPVGWADVATRHDLAGLEERFNGVDDRIAALAADLRASFEHELRSQITTVVFGLASVVLTMAALAFALVRFT